MKKLTLPLIALSLALTIGSALPTVAQEQKAPLSPPGQAKATIGSATVSIDYARPSIRGRKIMGALVPFDKVWRTGANAATTLKTDADIEMGGLTIPAGTYTVYSLPGEKAWTLIINKQVGQWGTQYDQAQDLGRVDLKVEARPQPLELFTITLSSAGPKAGLLTLEWETTKLSIPFTVK